MAGELLALNYMTRFRCSGSRCEDHCCTVWNVFVDEAAYRRLESAASRSWVSRDKLERALERPAPSGWYAKLRADEDGNCAFFEDGLCSLHRDLGESCLPGPCATYPRSVAHVGSRCELSGSLSCPELARLCLREPDAMDFVKVDWETLPEHCLVTSEVPETESAYTRRFDEVRRLIFDLLCLAAYPTAERLFFIAYFASQVSPFFHGGSNANTGVLLDREMRRMRDPLLLGELARQFRGLRVPSDFALRVVLGMIRSSLSGKRGQRHRELCVKVLRAYAPHLSDLIGDAQSPVPEVGLEEVVEKYLRGREATMKRFGARVEQYLASYALNYWFKELYTRSPDLLCHTQDLAVRLAVIKFLFFSHPDLAAHVAEGETQVDAVDRIAVEVVHTFARNIEHDAELLNQIRDQLGGDLSHLVCLIRF